MSDSLPAGRSAGFKITNARRIDRGALIGSFTVELPSQLVIDEVKLFAKEGRRWLGMPSRPWTDKNGEQKYSNIISFASKEAKDRFEAAVLPLLAGVL